MAAGILVAFDLAPRDTQRCDECAGKALILVREQQLAASVRELVAAE